MDKRRSKRAKARARMQRNYIAAKAQLRSAVPKRDRESKREQSKDNVHKQGTLVNVSAAYLANEEGNSTFLLTSTFDSSRLQIRWTN